MVDKEEMEGSVRAIKSLLRYIKLLENNSGNVISSVPAFANNKHLDLREVEQGKVMMHYILSNLQGNLPEQKVDNEND